MTTAPDGFCKKCHCRCHCDKDMCPNCPNDVCCDCDCNKEKNGNIQT